MNQLHLQYLSSPQWARYLETDLVPWVLGRAELGDDVLEVGPGPGLTTDVLRRRVTRLTAVEVDAELAAALTARISGTNVEVIHGDGTATGLQADRFSAATAFSMLHHMPSAELQDRLFAEVHRVLRPAGAFVGVDSIDAEPIRLGHVDDIFVPIDPETLGARLEAVGFGDVVVEVSGVQARFAATKR